MRTVAVRRQKDGMTLAKRIECADTLLSRFVGLIGRDRLSEGQGMLFRDCSSVHTLFMSFSIDVVYLDKDLVVVGVDTHLKPWRFGGLYWRSKHVVELPCYMAGMLQKGDKLEFIEEGA